MEQTARFQIPLLAPGQVQKELTHNEALERIAMLLCPIVEGPPQAEPPEDPEIGNCYLIEEAALGDWQGEGGSIACFTAGGWRFIAPTEGLSVTDKSSREIFQWRSGGWEAGIARCREVRIDGQNVLRGRQPAIPDPAGGTVVDEQCRAAVAAVLEGLRAHGLIG
ncbi:DUF2793 domain-containing protein [Sphingomonas sp. NSE70-1]|uniref:DUF2793 domain-containing protein n=1 Tax=Sphingomonas caseinilyticus TaxID=2908205 RepID=A0ABT0RX45_9SPHN|nr:DUF2793 domain-containing protein [Sphingomonas caseinilyticus]MCL6699594.1 DUF2793 domain-containing protein [Sphingomonas caseinilyticus]